VNPGIQITMDATDPEALGRFWAELLGYIEHPPPDGFSSWDEFLDSLGVPADQRDSAYAIIDPEGGRPRIFIQRVPEPKTVKNRVHLDVNVSDREASGEERLEQIEAEVERAIDLGATRLETFDEPNGDLWVVMRDPEGNEFCIQ
jgi:hypothetical protein